MTDDLTTRVASYAAGALTPDERRQLESELRRSPRRAAEVDEFLETAALLGLAVEPVAPSASARSQLLDVIAATPQHGTVTRGPWHTRPVAAVLGAAAAVLLVVGGAATALQLAAQPSAAQQIAAAADYEQLVADVDGGGSVTAMWSESLARAAIRVDGVADLPRASVYQAWLIDGDGHAESAGTFMAGSGAEVTMALIGSLDPGDAIGITIEPAGGSTAPTTTPVVVIPTA